MKIVLTNDDGVFAEGIGVLYRALKAAGHEVVLVAPHEERSASGHGITWKGPLKVRKTTLDGDIVYAVEGTPADSARFGLIEVMPDADFLVSGINSGANTGMDTLYSGTVSAAMEGVLLKKPALAVSRDFDEDPKKHYQAAAEYAVKMLAHLQKDPMPAGMLCNLNVPAKELDEVKGLRMASLSEISVLGEYQKFTSAISGDWYFLKPRAWADANPGSDRDLLGQGYATVTYLHWRLEAPTPHTLP